MEKESLAKDIRTNTFIGIEPSMWTRHGMIAGATGTGKTVTVRVLAEQLSKLGVPVFPVGCKRGSFRDRKSRGVLSETSRKTRETCSSGDRI